MIVFPYVVIFLPGDCLNVLSGQSAKAMALTFDVNNHLLSASGNGCVFVWTLDRRAPDDFQHQQLPSLSTFTFL